MSVDFKHGVCGYFYGENLARQYICGDIILRYRVSSKTCSLFDDLSAKTHLNAKFGDTSKNYHMGICRGERMGCNVECRMLRGYREGLCKWSIQRGVSHMERLTCNQWDY